MAKSSIVASTIPESPIYHGKRDVYILAKRFDGEHCFSL
jgi:hypothetical protein